MRLRDDVPAGHKVALRDIPPGGQVRKYGQVIGVATGPIAAGEHVHTHNLAFADFERDYAFGMDAKGHPGAPAGPPATFNGIVRADGQIATRNYLGILTSVNCSATVARMIAGQFQEGSELMAAFPNLDGVVALTHGSGCGMAGSGEGFDLLRRTLSGYARHPNFAGLLVLGLGCEVNQVRSLTEGFDLPSTTPVLVHDHPGDGGHPGYGARGHGPPSRPGRGSQQGRALTGAGQRTGPRAGVRRFGRLLGHYGQPGAGGGRRPAGPAREVRPSSARRPRSTGPSTC